MKTYQIKFEPIEIDSVIYPKYNIYYYYEDGSEELAEFHSTDGVSGTIREGYTLIE